MKQVTIFLIIITAVFYIGSSFSGCNNYATRDQLYNVRDELRDSISLVSYKSDRNFKEIMELRKEIYLLHRQLDTLRLNQDSLKAGQVLIYSAVKHTEENPHQSFSSFITKLRNYLNRY